jgi:hypothetical protein
MLMVLIRMAENAQTTDAFKAQVRELMARIT